MILGDFILGEVVMGAPSGGASDPDSPVVNVIIRDRTGKVTYLSRSEVNVLNEASHVDILSPQRSWVKISK